MSASKPSNEFSGLKMLEPEGHDVSLSALDIAKSMLESDPENSVLKKTVEILSADPQTPPAEADSVLAGAELALKSDPNNQLLRDAISLVQKAI